MKVAFVSRVALVILLLTPTCLGEASKATSVVEIHDADCTRVYEIIFDIDPSSLSLLPKRLKELRKDIPVWSAPRKKLEDFIARAEKASMSELPMVRDELATILLECPGGSAVPEGVDPD
jgi:hypothetical protein